MYLVQLLLPVQDGEGRPFNRMLFEELAVELTERFGGLTAYTRAPATGIWEEQPGRTVRDQVIVYEVMTEDLDASWWAALRQRLEAQFDQDELVVRAQEIRRL
jgi:hypothetical protein